MVRKLSGLLTVFSLVVVGLMVRTDPTIGQGQSDSHVVVIQEAKHDHFEVGPEDPLKSSMSTPGFNREIALRRTHAPGLMRLLRDPALQTSIGPTVATTSGTNSGGVGANGYAPPDTNGAAGATQYVQWVNVRFAVYDKSNGSLVYGPVNGNSIWSGFGGVCQNNNDGDPIAQYDKQAGRWVMLQPVFSAPYTICVAVSTTSTWTGSGITWNRYAFTVPNSSSNFPDYPKLSVWPDGYYLSYNSFTNGNSWAGPQACVMNRSAMLAGTAATMQCAATPGTQYGSLLPSDLDGAVPGVAGTTDPPPAGTPNYYLALYSNTQHTLFKFHVDWVHPANSTFTGPVFVNVSSFNEACAGGACIPQGGTNQKLDSLADRLMYRLAYRNFGDHESLVVSHSVNPGNGTSGIRWYEIRSPGASPFVFQQGTFAPDASYRWMPSIAQDKNGNMAVGYSISSSTAHPGISYTGRLATDPAGTMQSESPIITGGGSQLPSLGRWGDYSSMSIDPTDDCTFWYTNEYLVSNGTFNWSTWIASFSFPGCGGAATPDFSMSATPASRTVTAGNGTSYAVTATSLNGYSDNVGFSASGNPAGVTVSFNPTSVTPTDSTTMNVTTASNTQPGTYTIVVTGTHGSLTHSTNVTLIVNVPTFTLTANAPTSQSVVAGNGTGYSLTLTPLNTFIGPVTLGVTGGPASGFSYSFSTGSPVTITYPTATPATMNVTTTTASLPGTYTLTVKGTSGTLTSSATVTLVVTTAGTIALSANPTSLTIRHGSSGTSTITVVGSGYFSGSVTLSVSGMPSKVTASLSPNPVTLTAGGGGASSKTSTLTIKTSPGNKAGGPFPLAVKAVSGSITKTTTVSLTIN
jgi:hypothetical protein